MTKAICDWKVFGVDGCDMLDGALIRCALLHPECELKGGYAMKSDSGIYTTRVRTEQ